MVDGLHVRWLGGRDPGTTQGIGGETGPGGGGGGSAKQPSGKPIGAGMGQPGDHVVAHGHAAGVLRYSGFSSTLVDSFSTPGSPEGVTWDSSDTITGDAAGVVYKHSGFSESIIDSFAKSSPRALGTSIDVDGNLLFASDQDPGTTKHSGFSGTIIDSYSNLTDITRGVNVDTNGDTWESGYDSDHSPTGIFKHSGFGGPITDSFSGASDQPHGATWDGTNARHTENRNGQQSLHSGFSGTITDSFEISGFGGNAANDVEQLNYSIRVGN